MLRSMLRNKEIINMIKPIKIFLIILAVLAVLWSGYIGYLYIDFILNPSGDTPADVVSSVGNVDVDSGVAGYGAPVDEIDINKLNEEEIVDVRCWKCEGCGCDVHLLRTDEKIGHADYRETQECLRHLKKVEDEYYQYELEKEKFGFLQKCLIGLDCLESGEEVKIFVGCLECEGCGCDIFIVEKEDCEYGFNAQYQPLFSCLEKYQSIPGTYDEYYMMTKENLEDLTNCVFN